MPPEETPYPSELYDDAGNLTMEFLEDDAQEVIRECVAWLSELNRAIFLPIDLILVLLRRGHGGLEVSLRAAAQLDPKQDVLQQVEQLARRVDRDVGKRPKLHLANFSLGFTGILDDALMWAAEAERMRVSEEDIARVTRWRTQIQDSASVRWAIRQLAQPSIEVIFSHDGAVRVDAFALPMWTVLQQAMRLSADGGMSFLGTPHVVAALCTSRQGILWRAAEQSAVDPRRLREGLLRIVGTRRPVQPAFGLSRRTLTPRLVRMIAAAGRRATGDKIGEAEILYAFLEDGGSSLELVQALGLEPAIRHLLGEPKVRQAEQQGGAIDKAPAMQASSTPTLDLIGRDLSEAAASGTLPDVIGRDLELRRMINVLMRTEQRNPLLTGKAGVGKTALAAALAQAIHDKRVPDRLSKMRVIEINGASLVGGTSYRGELEARIKALLAEASDGVILFIDEAHAVFAPRSSGGQPAEVPNHFKAALASGDIAVVAATTDREYQRWIEQDPALRRRFERVMVPELTPALTREILVGLAPRFERDYEVPISPEAVDATIELSERFMPAMALPDKAKKLLMDATIAVASDLAFNADGSRGSAESNHTPHKRVVGRVDVAEQVALKTGIPADRINARAMGWWVGLGERLGRHADLQPDVVERAARALVEGRLAAAGRSLPQGILVLVGPPGAGKSELARVLAEEVFGDRKALIRLDMTEYQEPHTVSRLMGSPPGYVGYADEDAFVTPLRRRPSSVLLIDQFQRAHPRVQDRVARVLHDGEATDTHGMTADVRHTIVVITIDGDPRQRRTIGFADAAAGELLRQVAPGVLEHLEGLPYAVIPFQTLADGQGELGRRALDARIDRFRQSLLAEYGLRLELGETVIEALDDGLGEVKTAAELEALFHREVLAPATEAIIAGVADRDLRIGSDYPSSTGELLLAESPEPVEAREE